MMQVKLNQIARKAKQDKLLKCTSLIHHVNEASLDSKCFIEDPCAGKPQAWFCRGFHNWVPVMKSTIQQKQCGICHGRVMHASMMLKKVL